MCGYGWLMSRAAARELAKSGRCHEVMIAEERAVL